jgi:hypothetical protein
MSSQPPDKKVDVSAITDRIFAMGFPADWKTERRKNRNNIIDVVNWLNVSWPEKFMVCNFSRKSIQTEHRVKLGSQVAEFTWDRVYKTHTPPLDQMFKICYAMQAWLSLDEKNVLVLCCENGKTKTGVVVSLSKFVSAQSSVQ